MVWYNRHEKCRFFYFKHICQNIFLDLSKFHIFVA